MRSSQTPTMSGKAFGIGGDADALACDLNLYELSVPGEQALEIYKQSANMARAEVEEVESDAVEVSNYLSALLLLPEYPPPDTQWNLGIVEVT